MKLETGRVYCLVRGGEKRLASVLQYYFGSKYGNEFGNRILVLDGDITRPDLADQMPSDIQTVIHSAATVKHYGPYRSFERINVEGTGHVTAYAKKIGARLVHISTISVSGNSMIEEYDGYRSEEEKFFDETSLYIGQPLDNVYGRSKFEAERVVLDAMLEGLDGVIMRMGNLTNRTRDYKFQPNYTENAFLKRVKAGLAMGLLPESLLDNYMEFTPVDQAAECVIKLAGLCYGQGIKTPTIFHVNSNKGLYFRKLYTYTEALGIPLRQVSDSDFYDALQQVSEISGRTYIYEAFRNDLDAEGRLMYDSNIHIVNDFTVELMKQSGMEWIDVDLEYFAGYVKYFRELGYF